MKFTESPFLVTEEYAETLENKRRVYKEETKTRKATSIVLLSVSGLENNQHTSRISRLLDVDALFG